MRGLVIAAGQGRRMMPFTVARPKCMLPVGGRPLLAHTVDNLRAAGCDEVVVVVGHGADAIDVSGVVRVMNPRYATTNVLHSLMSAREYLSGPLMLTYSDIWVEPWIYRALAAAPGDITLAVDRDWLSGYEGRSDHPPSEAEKVHYDRGGRVVRIGKTLPQAAPRDHGCGEFLGLWRMSAEGARCFRGAFDELDEKLSAELPFQAAASWRLAYVTDLFQELADRQVEIRCCLVERGWAELDTCQDYERLPRVARTQRLWTLVALEAARTVDGEP